MTKGILKYIHLYFVVVRCTTNTTCLIIERCFSYRYFLKLRAYDIISSDPSWLLRLQTILSKTSSGSDCYAHCISFRSTKMSVSLKFLLHFHAWEIITIIVILDLYSGKRLAAIRTPVSCALIECFCPCIQYLVMTYKNNDFWTTNNNVI